MGRAGGILRGRGSILTQEQFVVSVQREAKMRRLSQRQITSGLGRGLTDSGSAALAKNRPGNEATVACKRKG